MAESQKKYELFDANQLAADEFFQQWVLNPSREATLFWEQFLKTNPEKQTSIEEARRLIEVLHFQLPALAETKVIALKKRLENSIGQPLFVSETPILPLRQSFFNRTRWMAAAAVILMLGTIFFWQYSNRPTEYTTSFGQTRQITLPDGSVVNLNANSSISFAQNFSEQPVREVWLKGEAFFSVKHTANHAKFRVHAEGLEVDVLGTEFNVSDRRNTTKVVLQSGKVQIKSAKQSAILQPGEMVEFSHSTKQLAQRKVPVERYSSWKEKVWLLDGEAMSEVAQRIEDSFGVEVVFENPSLANEKISGTIPTGSLEEVNEILSDLLKANCVLTNHKLIIK